MKAIHFQTLIEPHVLARLLNPYDWYQGDICYRELSFNAEVAISCYVNDQLRSAGFWWDEGENVVGLS